MEPCSYVKGSCGSDFAVFFIPAGNESKSCLRDLDDCREVFHFILGNVVVVDYLRGGEVAQLTFLWREAIKFLKVNRRLKGRVCDYDL